MTTNRSGDLGPRHDAPNTLATTLARGLDDPSVLIDDLAALGDYPLIQASDAHALADATGRLESRLTSGDVPLLRLLLGLYQGIESRDAFEILRAGGVPRLLSIFDARLSADPGAGEAEGLLFLLKVVTLYRVEGVVTRVEAAARRPLAAESFLWPVLFETFDENHPHRLALLNRLRDPLPDGLIGVSYLGLANACVVGGYLTHHPFDTPEGVGRLEDMLRDVEHPSHGLAAARALPFLSREAREYLSALAMTHQSMDIRIAAATADAKFGGEASLDFLAQLTLDRNHGRDAANALTELGRGGLIPARALAPEFVAVSEMAAWLAHPMEYGRPPDALEVVDSREIFWPPTNDRRRLWVVAFRYDPESPDAEPVRGVGLVGSITFCLPDRTTVDTPADDVYAIHCAWELAVNHDPRAPAVLSVEAGRAALGSDQ